jgi:hypothetical protein
MNNKTKAMERHMETAQIIWQQLLIAKQILFAWGISQKVGMTDVGVISSPNGDTYTHKAVGALRLTVTNTALGRKAFVYIALNVSDEYDVLIFKSRRYKTKFGNFSEYAELTHKWIGIPTENMHMAIDNALIGKTKPMKFETDHSLN